MRESESALVLPEGIKATETGLQFSETIDAETWERTGEALKRCEGALQWWIGDWWNYNQAKGLRDGKDACERIGLNYETSSDYGNVAARYEFPIRIGNLSFKHHQLTAYREDRAEWLERAAAEKWTTAELARQLRRDKHASQAIALPTGQYRVIYADPPWQYGDTRLTLQGYEATAAEHHYPTMSAEELCAMNVASFSAPNAVLFCWATFPTLTDAFAVVTAWGFEYKTAFIWDKGKGAFGNYHKAEAELLLVCTRGSCTPEIDTKFAQVQRWPRAEHSRKPEEARRMIDGMYPSGPRIELFRRGAAPDGWNIWGNEAEPEAAPCQM